MMHETRMLHLLPVATFSILIAATAVWASKRKKKKDTSSDYDWEFIAKQGFSMRKVPKDLDMIVIGSGIAGLTIAALMAKERKKVLLLEQHDVAGGNTHTFEEHGYEFDTGLHYVGGMVGEKTSPLRKLFDYISENGVQWERMDDMYDIAIVRNEREREEFPIRSGLNNLKKDLLIRFPEEAQAIETYFKMMQQVRLSIALLLMVKLVPPFLANLLTPFIGAKLQIFQQTTMEVLSGLTRNTKLMGVLTYLWGDYGEQPARGAFAMNALILDHFVGGAFYPVGGPSVIAKKIIPVIEKAGGKVLVRAPVISILIDESGTAYGVEVRGNRIRAPKVVSTVGVPTTFQKLVPEEHRHRIQKQLNGLKDPGIAPAISLLSLFVGIKGDAEILKIPKRNIWLFPSWDHDKNCDAFRKDSSKPFPAIFLSFPSRKDPTYKERYPGKQVALIIAPAYYERFEKFKDLRVKHRGAEYNKLKKEIADRLQDILFKEFPQLKGKVEYVDLGTPVTCDYYLGNYRGACYGLSHTPARFMCDWLSPTTPIQNLFVSGQDILSNGIGGAAMSGVLCAMKISNSFLLRKSYYLLA